MRRELHVPIWWIKLSRYEFWPVWLFYSPFIFYWLYLAIRARDFNFLFKVNPKLHYGGAIGTDKHAMLKSLHPNLFPKSSLLAAIEKESIESVVGRMAEEGLQFPVILKPNAGERGRGVQPIQNAADLADYISAHKGCVIIQEFIQSPHELGIFYYRLPGEKQGEITSIVRKKLLTLSGDGKSTIRQL